MKIKKNRIFWILVITTVFVISTIGCASTKEANKTLLDKPVNESITETPQENIEPFKIAGTTWAIPIGDTGHYISYIFGESKYELDSTHPEIQSVFVLTETGGNSPRTGTYSVSDHTIILRPDNGSYIEINYKGDVAIPTGIESFTATFERGSLYIDGWSYTKQ